LVPVPFSGYKPVDAYVPDRPDILKVGIVIDRLEKAGFPARVRFTAFPAPRNLFLRAAFPDPAERGVAIITAPFLHLNLTMAPVVTFMVIFKGFPKRLAGERPGTFFIPGLP
jgi:hypothetical protein